VQIYERRPAPVWHFDLYRLERPEEAYELDLEDAFSGAISLIEWPERLGPLLPAERLDVRLFFTEDADGRRVELAGHGSWSERLGEL
jgi:tRNA threonylcarbamoyladenosine biosynthesis protein TsaE